MNEWINLPANRSINKCPIFPRFQELESMYNAIELTLNGYVDDEITKADLAGLFTEEVITELMAVATQLKDKLESEFDDVYTSEIALLQTNFDVIYGGSLEALVAWQDYFTGKRDFTIIARTMDVWLLPVSTPEDVEKREKTVMFPVIWNGISLTWRHRKSLCFGYDDHSVILVS